MALTRADIELFLKTLKEISTYDLSDYSENSLKRRIEKLLLDNNTNLQGLIYKISSNKQFVEKIVRDITVNTTELFRDVKTWHKIRYRILPKLAHLEKINILHAGCSSGQEVYSMLILLNELNLFDKTNVYATDLNSEMIEKSKKGLYKFRFNLNYLDNYDKVIKENPFNFDEIRDVPYENYFHIDKDLDIIKMKDFLINKPTYAVSDLVRNENEFYKKYDLILCRNVLIYFNNDLQNRVLINFHSLLNNNGFLVVGVHERILGEAEEKFIKKSTFYIKK